MGIMQDLYDQVREETLEERNIEIVINLLKLNQSVELISSAVEMPADKIIAIGKERGLM